MQKYTIKEVKNVEKGKGGWEHVDPQIPMYFLLVGPMFFSGGY